VVRRQHGRNHSYTIDGQKVPGVTTIIGDGIPKPALTRWAAKSVAEFVADNLDTVKNFGGRGAIIGALSQVPFDNRDEAANRGTEVHKLAEQLSRGGDVEVPDVLAGHVDSHLRFLADWQPRDEMLELVIVNYTWRYAGTLDLIATLRDGKRWLLDYKTSRSGIFAETALQLAAYRRGEACLINGVEQPMPQVDACGAIWLREDGYSFYPVAADDAVFKAFLWAKGIGKFLDGAKERVIGAELRPVA